MAAVFLMMMFLVLVAGCRQGDKFSDAVSAGTSIEKNGVRISIAANRTCNYTQTKKPAGANGVKKLLLYKMEIIKTEAGGKTSPLQAILMDSRGNYYKTAPGIIAIAQAKVCIKSDDIKAYNAIWNETCNQNELYKAFVLGFDVPADAIPEKLFWNKEWLNIDIFFKL